MTISAGIKGSQSPPTTSRCSLSVHNKGSRHETALKYQDVGVWTTMREVGASWTLFGLLDFGAVKEWLATFPFLFRFFRECFGVGPWLATVYVISCLWESTNSAVELYSSSRLLSIIQQSILSHQVDRQALMTAVFYRLGFTLADSIMEHIRLETRSTLSNRVRYHFEERLLQANLRLDLPTFEEPETASKINRLFSRYDRGGAWEIFHDLLDRFHSVVSVLSQASFLFGVLGSQHGSKWFVVMCILKAAVQLVTFRPLSPSYTWDSNVHYRRLSSLVHMGVDEQHRIEIVSNVLTGYIQREWRKARKLLGDASDNHPFMSIHSQRPLMLTLVDAISQDFPLIFYAYQVSLSPEKFSLMSVALVQHASASLAWTVSRIMSTQKSIEQRLIDIKALYESSNIQNNLQDGESHYPRDGKEISAGMEITFEAVSFAYPNSENVLKDISFTIRRGQLVVIVGVNGSGKSTLLKLFNRLYDPSSGTVLVDGAPMRSFRASDLRGASAMLFQNYSHFPLSIRENITMGLPDEDLSMQGEKSEKNDEDDPVATAAYSGGAKDFITKQTNGFATVLRPYVSAWSTNNVRHLSGLFQKKIKEITMNADVSQGQWQRLALSRLFFRAAGNHIKMVAVDEPSASLDPEMEYELFGRLKELSIKKGKTMVFVTHRFGHLTKQADLILVMQGGRLVEQGKHDELLEMGGEYAKLYKLQAGAFLSSVESK